MGNEHSEGNPAGIDAAAGLSDHGSSGDTAVLTDPSSQLAAVTAERDALLAERSEWSERLMRRQADFENYRRRNERERADIAEFASMEAARAVLPILDDFERALKVESADPEYAKGMQLIYNRLFEAVKKLGVEPIESLGKSFDPHFHHAIELVSGTGQPDQTVVDELQKGYNFKGRLLRPAMVKVSTE